MNIVLFIIYIARYLLLFILRSVLKFFHYSLIDGYGIEWRIRQHRSKLCYYGLRGFDILLFIGKLAAAVSYLCCIIVLIHEKEKCY